MSEAMEENSVQFAEDPKTKVMMGMIQQYTAKAKFIRLLAEENITISFEANARTASCEVDGDRRRVNLPINVHLSNEDVFYMFSSHEVGHALWSTQEYVKKANDLKIFDSWNIVEDIRIERLVKEKWPGLVKNYIAAYKKLVEEGFFGVVDRWPYMSFADRLNIYAKVGPIIGGDLKFTQEEIAFYNRCISAKSENDAFILAIELFEMNKKKKTLSFDGINIEDLARKFSINIEPEIEYDEDGNEIGEEEPLTEEEIKKLIESTIEQFNAQDEFDSKMGQGAINNATVIAYETYKKNDVLPYQEFIKNGREWDAMRYGNSNQMDTEGVKKMRQQFSRSVDIMTVQFEMKKAAWQSKNSKISKTGTLNLSRLHAYKTSDDLFMSAMEIPDAKNHGFVILLDASGSIMNEWEGMIKQTILLTEFYKKIGAHFKVVLFGAYARYNQFNHMQEYKQDPCQLHTNDRSGEKLIEVLCSSMTKKDYTDACRYLLNEIGFSFGGTPMVKAFNNIETYGNEFFNKHRVTKKKVVLITDGRPMDSCLQWYKGSVIVSDQMTKKNYISTATSRGYDMLGIDVVSKIYKDRYDIDFIPMMLVKGTAQVNYNYSAFTGKKPVGKISLKEGFHQTESALHTKVFFIKSSDVETEIDLEQAENGSIKDIQRQFKKALAGNRKSAVLMRVLAEQLAI